MVKRLKCALAGIALLPLAACVTPVGPVEVTRFHRGDAAPIARGTIAVEPAPGADAGSLEWQSYRNAVMRQLILLGYSEAASGSGAQIAQVKLTRTTIQPGASSGPVSVGVGGSTGTYGTGGGIGIGINLSPKPKAQVVTVLAVSIRDRASDQVQWEGRASFTVGTASPLAATSLAAPKLSEALFLNFPGRSGETIEVK